MSTKPWRFVVSTPGRIPGLQRRLPPAEMWVSEVQFSNGDSAGTYLMVGDFLAVTIWQPVVRPPGGVDYVWDYVADPRGIEPPKFTVMAAPGVEVTSGVGAALPVDIYKDPSAQGLPLFMQHPSLVAQRRAGNNEPGPEDWQIDPPLDIVRVQERALLPSYDAKIRVDTTLTGWDEAGGMRVQPRPDGVSIFSSYSSPGGAENPIEIRIKVQPGSGEDTFAYRLIPHGTERSRGSGSAVDDFFNMDQVMVVSTPGVTCDVVRGSDFGALDRLRIAHDKTLAAIADRPAPEDIPKPTWTTGYNRYGMIVTTPNAPYVLVPDGPDPVEVFWPVFKIGADLGIGMVPIAGDLVDLADFGKALFTGTDKWGDKVGSFELALMGLGVLIPAVGSGAVRRLGRGAVAAGAAGADLAVKSAGSTMTSLYRMLEQSNVNVRNLIEGAGGEAYLQMILSLKPHEMTLVQRASDALHDMLKTERYVERLEAKLPPKGRVAEPELPSGFRPTALLDIFRTISGAGRRVFPPAGSLDDLVAEAGDGFKAPFLQTRYAQDVARLGDDAPPPKQWLRDKSPNAPERVYVRNWMGDAAEAVEFGARGVSGQRALDDYLDAILDEASEGPGHLGRAFDYDRFPIDRSSGVTDWPSWTPGLPIDMPNAKAAKPSYATASKRGRKNLAFFEFRIRVDILDEVPLADGTKLTAARMRGASEADLIRWADDPAVREAMDGLDAIPAGTQAGQPFWRADMPFSEVRQGLEGRAMRRDLNGGELQFEHFKPQRTYNGLRTMLVGGDLDLLHRVSGIADPRNLMPLPVLRHWEVDAVAARWATDQVLSQRYRFAGTVEALESLAVDTRVTRSFLGYTDTALRELSEALRLRGRIPASSDARRRASETLQALTDEADARNMTLVVPTVNELGRGF